MASGLGPFPVRRSRLLTSDLGTGILDGTDDVVISGATAQVPLDAVSDLGLRRVVILLEKRHGRHDHPGSAESALETVAFPESLLDGVKLAIVRQTLDRKNR